MHFHEEKPDQNGVNEIACAWSGYGDRVELFLFHVGHGVHVHVCHANDGDGRVIDFGDLCDELMVIEHDEIDDSVTCII